MPETELESLVYVSSAVKLLTPAEIAYLLKRARERNEEYGITGVLLYIGGNFMQYIEGPRENLDVIFKIIQEDKQHTGLIVVSRESLEHRQFAGWSMAYQTRDIDGYEGTDTERRVIEKNFEPLDDNPSTARIVLHSFWNRGGS